MNRWGSLLLAAAAVGAAVAVVTVVAQRARERSELEQVPAIIEDCFERIEEIKQDLQRLKPGPTA